MKYAVVGLGRMGRAVDAEAERRGHARIAVVDPAVPGAGSGVDASVLADAEVAFEFTTPATAEANVLGLVRLGVPVVCGTTGWEPSAAFHAEVREAPAGVVIAPNFSPGMNLFYRLVRAAGHLFGAVGLYDPYVLEAHHRGKSDAPSGTARRLAAILLETDRRIREIREGNPDGPLAAGAMHVVSLRAGHEPGSHTVGFDGEHDRIVLRHDARGRAGLALGAVLAAEWVIGRPGIHGFDAILDDLLDRPEGGDG